MRLRITVIFALLLCMTIAMPAEAQVPPTDSSPSSIQSGSQFVHEFFRPGRSTQTVHIVGDVGNAGIWRVEPEVDLVELLSAARMGGVGRIQAERTRTTSIRIYRSLPEGRELHYETTFDQLMRDRAAYPTLQANDVIEVETRERRTVTWRDVSSIVGTASSLTVLFFRIFDL